MFKLNDAIRLTDQESEQLERVTGFAPVGIKTVPALHKYIERCKQHYRGDPENVRALHAAFDATMRTLLGEPNPRYDFGTLAWTDQINAHWFGKPTTVLTMNGPIKLGMWQASDRRADQRRVMVAEH